MTLVLAITGTSVALQFVFFTYSAVFTAVQRFDLSNIIGISTRILSAVATIMCLNAGYGLVGLSLVVAGDKRDRLFDTLACGWSTLTGP